MPFLLLGVLGTTSSFRRKSESRWGVLLLPKRTVDSKPPLIPPWTSRGRVMQSTPWTSRGRVADHSPSFQSFASQFTNWQDLPLTPSSRGGTIRTRSTTHINEEENGE